MFIIILGVVFLLGLIYLANLYEAGKWQQTTLLNLGLLGIVGVGGILVLLVMLTALAPMVASLDSETQTAAQELPNVKIEDAFNLLVLTTVLSLISIAVIFSERVRKFIQRYLIRSDGYLRRYDAGSIVHTTAIVLSVFLVINTAANFVAVGGMEGLAEEFAENGFSAVDMLTNLLLYLLASLVGVGILTRRSFPDVMERLGIHWPSKGTWRKWVINGLRNITMGVLVGFGIFWVQVALSLIWQLSSSPELIAEQTAASQELFIAVGGSLFLGFLLAFTAGVGEELLFRGALQPIFGNVLVSIFFMSLHSQYALTPASLILLVVSLVFGLVRTHYSTTAAMVAHFVYNFTPFVFVFILTQLGLPLESLF